MWLRLIHIWKKVHLAKSLSHAIFIIWAQNDSENNFYKFVRNKRWQEKDDGLVTFSMGVYIPFTDFLPVVTVMLAHSLSHKSNVLSPQGEIAWEKVYRI